jgi:transcriptional regulator with XRE-family HTH domain
MRQPTKEDGLQIPRLRQWREFRGLTQKDLAAVSEVSVRSIAGYEAGAGIRVTTARKLAEALDIEVADFYAAREPQSPLAQAPSSQAKLFDNGPFAEERRSPLSAWAKYARRMADRIRLHTADAHSPAFRDPLAAMFFVEERNRDAAELWLHFEEELGREPLADEPLTALNAALAAFEELAEALAEVQRRADRMAAGFAESEIGQARRRRAAEAAAQWEQAVTQFNARRKRRGA